MTSTSKKEGEIISPVSILPQMAESPKYSPLVGSLILNPDDIPTSTESSSFLPPASRGGVKHFGRGYFDPKTGHMDFVHFTEGEFQCESEPVIGYNPYKKYNRNKGKGTRKFRGKKYKSRDDYGGKKESYSKSVSTIKKNHKDEDYSKIYSRIDEPVVSPSSKQDDGRLGYINTIDWSKESQLRSGVITYRLLEDGQIWFGLGIDYKTRNLTDFAGGVKRKELNPIVGGLREFSEETLGVFGDYTEDEVGDCLTIYSPSMMIMFLQLEVDPDSISKEYRTKVKKVRHPEIRDIVWYPWDIFKKIIYGDTEYPILYSKVASLIKTIIEKYGDLPEFL